MRSAPVQLGTEFISLVPSTLEALVSMVGCVLTLRMVTGQETCIADSLTFFFYFYF